MSYINGWTIVLGFMALLFALYYYVITPLERRDEQRRRAKEFYRHCPERLLEALWPKTEQELSSLTDEEKDTLAKELSVSKDAVHIATKLLSSREVTIIVHDHEPWSAKFRDLTARLVEDRLVFDLSEARVICTTYEW